MWKIKKTIRKSFSSFLGPFPRLFRIQRRFTPNISIKKTTRRASPTMCVYEQANSIYLCQLEPTRSRLQHTLCPATRKSFFFRNFSHPRCMLMIRIFFHPFISSPFHLHLLWIRGCVCATRTGSVRTRENH